MPDAKSKPGDDRHTRIDVNHASELRDWAITLGVSVDELKAAVNQVGDQADAVAKYLIRKNA